MKRRSGTPGISGFLMCMATCLLAVSLIWTPRVEGSNIQLSADGTYAPQTISVASQGDAAGQEGTKDTLSTLYAATENDAAVPPAILRDIMLVIDNSGSMKKNDPEFATKRAVTRFLDQLEPGDRCGIVLFDSQARLLAQLLEMKAPESVQRLKNSLNRVNYQGQRTNSPAGIERAIYELRTSGREGAVKSIIFLTDGIVDTGSPQSDAQKTRWLREDLTSESRKEGIRIFGVAFTENADFQLIQSLAVQTEGTYYRAMDAASMEAAFDAIAEQLKPNEGKSLAETGTPSSTPPPPAVEAKPAPGASELPTFSGDDNQAVTQSSPESASTTTVQAGPTASDQSAGPVSLRGMWKIYLPLFIIALLLISVLAYTILKIRGARGPVTSRILDFLPDDKAQAGKAVKVPEAQLIDLDHASADGDGPLLVEKMQTTIGRDPRNDVVINQPTISGFHACITFERDRFELEDYRSTNGSFVNGLRLEADVPKHLKTGDCIKFADFEFRFMRLDRIPDDQTVMLSSSVLPAAAYTAPPPEKPLPAEEMGSHFQTVLKSQLERISDLGEPFARFVQDHLDTFTQNLLSAKISNHLDEDGTGAFFASDVLHRPPIAFKLCQLPVPPKAAAAWFETAHGGFLSFLEEILDSEVQQQPGCDTLCLICYGWEETPWASLSIIPAGEGDHPVEIMSVEFLTPKEVDMLGLEFDENGRILSSIHTGVYARDADATITG
jgi:Mg-chelatase subunit ChlD